MATSMHENWLLPTTQNFNNLDKRRCKEALLQTQKYIRSSPGPVPVRAFRECGGLKRLMSALKSSQGELLDLSLSIVATCCREPTARLCVKELHGVPILANIIKAQSVVSIINRASRALANLAEDPQICSVIHSNRVVPLLVKLLGDKDDSNCRQSIVRALRILADDDKHKWEVTKNEGIQAIISCIQSDDESLVSCGILAMATITTYQHVEKADIVNKYLKEAARQIITDPDHVKILLGLLAHSKTGIREQALVTLFNLMPVAEFRVAVGNGEGVQIFIEKTHDKASASFSTYLHCLCCCCRESVNRAKVRDLGGLNILIEVLKSDTEACQGQHEQVLSALLNYYYDEPSLAYMASLGFIDILVSQLLSCTIDKREKKEHCSTGDEYSVHEINATTSNPDNNKEFASQNISCERTTTRCIPFQAICTDTSYTSGLSPEIKHSGTENMFLPGPSAASPPHIDWGMFMSRRPRHVAPDVSPLSSASPRSVSPPRFSPQYSPQWSPHWSPHWSPDYSPQWQPSWSPESSPEHHSESSEWQDKEFLNSDSIPVSDLEEIQNQSSFKGVISNINREDNFELTSSELLEGQMETTPGQLTTNIGASAESVTNTAGRGHLPQLAIHSLPKACDRKSFRTPDTSDLKFRSGKRKAKLRNIPMKAKCLEFTPADLPLQSVMSSPSHSSTCTTDNQDLTPEHKGREHDTLCMLSRYSHMDNPNRHLSDRHIISGLLEYWVTSSSPHRRCWRVLTRLVENRHCFERLLLQVTPMVFYEKLYFSNRTQNVFKNKMSNDLAGPCKSVEVVDEKVKMYRKSFESSDVEMEDTDSLLYRLGSMAASHFGEGVMEHLLLTDDDASRVACVLAVPYVCRNPKFLRKMLIKHRGLDILLAYLKESASSKTDLLYERAVACLHDLANMLDVQHPLLDINREASVEMLEQSAVDTDNGVSTENKLCLYCKHASNSSETNMIFKLDDGTRISAHRQLISQQSDYFASLLEGNYLEATQMEVPLRHISRQAFLCILHHLYGCHPMSCKQTKECLEESASIAMETVARAGQFLLPRLQDMVCNITVTNHMSPSCVVEMYEFGHLHGCCKLSDMCVLYILCCHDVCGVDYKGIANRGCRDLLYEEMRNVILKQL